ncbi:MAG: hypothetical protein AAGU23_06610 [Bacillota bacterium]
MTRISVAEARAMGLLPKKEKRKPTPDDRIRELKKAGALIAAEIDRLQRKEEQ